MSSQIAVTQSSNTHQLAHILGTYALFSLPQWHRATATHPALGDNQLEHERAVRKNAEPSKNGLVKLNQLRMQHSSTLLPIFRAATTFILLLPNNNNFNSPFHAGQGNLQANPPSTYFRHQHPSSHTVHIHSFHMPKPSKYSLTRSTR